MLAFLASRTIGLPQIGDDVGMGTEEPLGPPAVIAEALMAGLAWVHLRPHRSSVLPTAAVTK
ncbi:MAG: hypothetical protein ACR2K3_10005 [Nocardioides sp.]